MTMALTIQQDGRRYYLMGNTYPIRDQLRDAGFHWDGEKRAWWTGERKKAEKIVSATQGKQVAPGRYSTICGRAEYKGKTYYVASREFEAKPITTSDGHKVLLFFRDGSSQFWAPRSLVRIVKSYQQPRTIADIQEYAERAAEGDQKQKADAPTRVGCSMCGDDVPAMRTPRGWLCRDCAMGY